MKYEIAKLDGRFTYRDLFGYYIKFSNSMSRGQGPLHFNSVLEWFRDTYGWSAEIRQYDSMLKWVNNSQRIINQFGAGRLVQGTLNERPDCCNPYWSWTNGYDDLRIYVATEKELGFFQLAWSINDTR
jgi:hypothetical protein